jgi:hypothetical protein
MRAFLPFAALLLSLGACRGAADSVAPPPPPPKPDPYVTVRVRDLMDTTTAPGRATWHTFLLLTGPYTAQNGIANQGVIALKDIRLQHGVNCIGVSADSVGQRLISPIALADTTTSAGTPDATALAIVTDWYNGNHTLPAGWMALVVQPIDAFQSAQYNAGHGLTPSDPIKWSFDWTGAGTTSFYERTDADSICGVIGVG